MDPIPMPPFATLLGLCSVVAALVGYVPYLWSAATGKTKPHAFSWIIWGTTTAISFAAQWSDRAGAGAWATGITACSYFMIAVLALVKGETETTRGDWISLIGALMAIPLWCAMRSPLWSVILVTAIEVVGFYPTYRKAYTKPDEEMVFTFLLCSCTYALSLLALEHWSIVTAFYPAVIAAVNGVFVAMVVARRRLLNRSN
jgi:hypothetical protein